MAPRQKAISDLGCVALHGNRWRARIHLNSRNAEGPLRATQAEAQVDLDGARQLTTRAEIPEFMASLHSCDTQPAAQASDPATSEGAHPAGEEANVIAARSDDTLGAYDVAPPRKRLREKTRALTAARKLSREQKNEEDAQAPGNELGLHEAKNTSSGGGLAQREGGKLLNYRGLNIQKPWARLILEGVKTVEARRYPLKNYENTTLWIIETPQKASFARLSADQLALVFGEDTSRESIQLQRRRPGDVQAAKQRAHIVGTVLFAGCFEYMDYEQWRADAHRHRMPAGSDFDWNPNAGPMYGWLVGIARALIEPQPAPVKRGMIGSAAVTRMARFC